MIHDNKITGKPLQLYVNTKANIQALSGLTEGCQAYASDTDEVGYYNGSAWTFYSSSAGISGTGSNTRVTFWTGTNTVSSSANLIWNNSTGSLGIGGSPFTVLTIIGSGGNVYLGSSAAPNVNKIASIVTGRYASGLVSMFSADIQSGDHAVNFGGGLGGNYTATTVRFYTGADINTTTGVVAMSIDNNQNVGIGIDPASYRLHALLTNATLNASDTVFCLGHNSSGTPAANFGLTQLFTLKSDTTNNTSAADITVSWATATHNSRKARITGKVYDTSARTWLQVDTDGASSDVLINSLIYGSFYMDDGNQTVTATLAGSYYQISAGMSTGLCNGMTFQNSRELLVTVAGTYKVDWSLSVSNNNSDQTISGAVMVNTAEKHETENATRVKENGLAYTLGGTGIIALAVNDTLKLCVENETSAGSTITVSHANLSVVRIGE